MAGYGCSETGDSSGFRGCGRIFTQIKYFDNHFVKVTTEDDESRDRAVVAIDGTRCKTDDELIKSGLEQKDNGYWHDPEVTENINL